MVVTVVGCSGGGTGGNIAEHGGGCALTCRAGAGLPAPPLQAASTRAANTGSTEISRLQVCQVRAGDWVRAAAPRRDDKLIATPVLDWDHAVAGLITCAGWADHSRGYVINIERTYNPRDVRIHAAYCATITGTPARGDTFTGDWIKVCSRSLTELGNWAKQHTGAVVKRCGTSRPSGPAHP